MMRAPGAERREASYLTHSAGRAPAHFTLNT